MAKKAGFLALGGHISSQNASFRTIMETLKGWEFYGLENGFNAFKTGIVYPLSVDLLNPYFAGFYAGAARAKITDDKGMPDTKKINEAIEFVEKAGLDYLVGSCGDDHGAQMEILRQAFVNKGLDCKVLVLSKTMDGDKGGKDGTVIDGYVGPFADTTNGFATAVETAANNIHLNYSGAWTNEVVTIISLFGRETNWVSLASAWYGHADRIFPGELDDNDKGYSIERIAELAGESMKENKRDYGRSFAVLVFPEGTRIQGIKIASDTLLCPHGHPKLNPENIAVGVSEGLQKYRLKPQSITLTYILRNSPPTETDMRLAGMTGLKIAEAMEEGLTGLEAAIKFRDGRAVSELVPTHLASQKRYANYYPNPLYDAETLKPLPEIENYFRPLFGEGRERGRLFPKKPMVVNVYHLC